MFSGIGGFEYGIQKSEYGDKLDCIGYSEVDKYATNIYRRHFPNHVGFGDATKIRTETLQDFDLLVGGFPCQAFSHAGKRQGFNDTRGTLFFEIARVLQDKRPEYFLLENVKGLLSHDRGNTFSTMLRVLSDLGYDVQWQIYNSKNYGVAQNRERLYIKGFSRERERCPIEILPKRKKGKTVNAEQGKTEEGIRWQYTSNRQGKLVNTDYNALTITASGQNSGSKQYIRVDKEQSPSSEIIQVNDKKGQAQKVYDINGCSTTLCANGGGDGGKTGLYLVDEEPKIKKVVNISPSGHHNGDVYDTSGISRTLLARDYKDPVKIKTGNCEDSSESEKKCVLIKNNTKKGYLECEKGDGILLSNSNARGKVQKKQTSTLDSKCSVGTLTNNYRIRRLTPIECERLQGFPDDWTKYGADDSLISDTQRYKCIGNAVTTNVITYIFNEWDLGI